VKRSGAASASAVQKLFAKFSHRLPLGDGLDRHEDVDALAAAQQREAFQAQRVDRALELEGRILHLPELDSVARIEVDDQPVGRFDRPRAAAPAVELDRLHLRAGDDLFRALDEEILFGPAVLLLDRFEMSQPVELLARRRMLSVALEETFALAAAEQVQKPAVDPRQQHRRGDLIIKRRRPNAEVRPLVGRLGRPRHGDPTRPKCDPLRFLNGTQRRNHVPSPAD
jgi:hypothetical protein